MKPNALTTFDILKFAEANNGELPNEIELLPAGKWTTTKYPDRPIEIDQSIMDKMIANFKAGHRGDGLPIDTDHDEGKANGWIKDLFTKVTDKGLRLMGKVEWNGLGKQQVGDKIYRFISPEFHFNFKKPLTGEVIGPTLLAATITNRPLFNIMKPLRASEKEGLTDDKSNDNLELYIQASDTTMNINDILKKAAKDRTPEEKKFLTDSADKFTPEQKTQFEKEVKESTDAKATADKQAADKAASDKAAADKAAADAKTAGSENVTIKASELQAMNEKINATEKKLKMNELGQEFDDKFSFNDKNLTGKILPKARNEYTELVYSLDEHQVGLFNKVMEAVPDKKLFGETGSSKDANNGVLTAGEKIEKLIDEKMKENKDLSYEKASELVTTGNKELWAEYETELKEGK